MKYLLKYTLLPILMAIVITVAIIIEIIYLILYGIWNLRMPGSMYDDEIKPFAWMKKLFWDMWRWQFSTKTETRIVIPPDWHKGFKIVEMLEDVKATSNPIRVDYHTKTIEINTEILAQFSEQQIYIMVRWCVHAYNFGKKNGIDLDPMKVKWTDRKAIKDCIDKYDITPHMVYAHYVAFCKSFLRTATIHSRTEVLKSELN